MTPGGYEQREQAIRLAVNVAMYAALELQGRSGARPVSDAPTCAGSGLGDGPLNDQLTARVQRGPAAVGHAAALALAALSFILLAFEMRRRERGGGVILVSGVLAVVALLVAVLRPVRIAARESTVGARVLLLADASRSMALPQPGGGTRADARDRASVRSSPTRTARDSWCKGSEKGPALRWTSAAPSPPRASLDGATSPPPSAPSRRHPKSARAPSSSSPTDVSMTHPKARAARRSARLRGRSASRSTRSPRRATLPRTPASAGWARRAPRLRTCRSRSAWKWVAQAGSCARTSPSRRARSARTAPPRCSRADRTRQGRQGGRRPHSHARAGGDPHPRSKHRRSRGRHDPKTIGVSSQSTSPANAFASSTLPVAPRTTFARCATG